MNSINLWPENYCVNCSVLRVKIGWRWEDAEKTKTWILRLQKCLALPCGFPWVKDLSRVQEPKLIHVVVLWLVLQLKHARNMPVTESCLHSLFYLFYFKNLTKLRAWSWIHPIAKASFLNLPSSWDYKPVSPGPGSGLLRKRRELCASLLSLCSKPYDWKKKVYFSYIFTPPPVT